MDWLRDSWQILLAVATGCGILADLTFGWGRTKAVFSWFRIPCRVSGIEERMKFLEERTGILEGKYQSLEMPEALDYAGIFWIDVQPGEARTARCPVCRAEGKNMPLEDRGRDTDKAYLRCNAHNSPRTFLVPIALHDAAKRGDPIEKLTALERENDAKQDAAARERAEREHERRRGRTLRW